MNPSDFTAASSGRLVPTIERALAFVPNPLPPPKLDLARLAMPLANASLALGELNGIGRNVPNPNLFISPFSRAEAVASSKIEGTFTPTPELLKLELAPDATGASSDTREVHNYSRALYHGLSRIKELPLSKRLFNELHSLLLEGVAPHRGARFIPGELRKDQNWIGARTIQTARYVPPPPSEVQTLMDSLERFANRSPESLHLLIKVALMHYQFEAIHPYPDGNGRVGRLMIPIFLCDQNAMPQPLLYLSPFFEANYNRYIDLMFDVSRNGAWEDWIEFFLLGVETSAKNAVNKIHAMQDLHLQYMNKIRTVRASGLLAKIVDDLFRIPAVTIPYSARQLDISYNSAKNHLEKLVQLQILVPYIGDERPQWYFAREIMSLANLD